MNKLIFLLFLLPLTSNAQLYISPIIGIYGLHLEVQNASFYYNIEESYKIDHLTYGGYLNYNWNRLSIGYLGTFSKKRYNFLYFVEYINITDFFVDMRKHNLTISYEIINNLDFKADVYYMKMKNIIYKDVYFGYEYSNVSLKDYGVELGLNYEYRHFFITASYNQGLKTDEDSFFKPSKSYSIYLGYQFKIFDPKWFNKKGQKCPKF